MVKKFFRLLLYLCMDFMLIKYLIGVFFFKIKRSDFVFYWEEREIMVNVNSEWIV